MRSPDLNQRADSDSGAAACGCLPFGATFEELGPERKEAALCGFGRVDGATTFEQEMALFLLWFAEAEEVAGAVDEAALKFRSGEAEMAGGTEEVVLGEIDVALDIATAGAAVLARELQGLHVGRIA